MTRMTLLSLVLVVGLTVVVLVDHVRGGADVVAPEATLARSHPVAAPTRMPPTRDVHAAGLRIRLLREVLEPLREARSRHALFSRARPTRRALHLEVGPPTDEEQRPPADDRRFVHFEVQEEGGRFDPDTPRRLLFHGRVDARSGAIELAAARGPGQAPAWQPAAVLLARAGVR